MSNDVKPLPHSVKGVVSQKFWGDLKEGKFMYQQCADCGAPIFYPRVLCPTCMSENLTWYRASGEGKIYSFTVVYRAMDPRFQLDVPYVVALIDLVEGIRVMGNVVGWDDPEALQIDQPVKMEYVRVTEEFTLPVFRLVGEK